MYKMHYIIYIDKKGKIKKKAFSLRGIFYIRIINYLCSYTEKIFLKYYYIWYHATTNHFNLHGWILSSSSSTEGCHNFFCFWLYQVMASDVFKLLLYLVFIDVSNYNILSEQIFCYATQYILHNTLMNIVTFSR